MVKEIPMIRITFKNGIEVDDENYKRASASLESTRTDLNFYMIYGSVHENNDEQAFIEDFCQCDDLEDIEIAINNWKNLPPFNEYGLCFDYVAKGTFDDQDEGYYRYQFSWGGPSDELRIYKNEFVEYVWMDWGIGIGFDISHDDYVDWLIDWFEGMGMIDWNDAREKDYENAGMDEND
jgi:hypothetical protein